MDGGDADVVDEGIEPDVGDVTGVEGDRDAPVEARDRAGDAQVLENIVLEQADHLVSARFGVDE